MVTQATIWRSRSVSSSRPPTGAELGATWRLNIDTTLRVTDGDGRDLLVSCGAALHHLVVGLALLLNHTVGCVWGATIPSLSVWARF